MATIQSVSKCIHTHTGKHINIHYFLRSVFAWEDPPQHHIFTTTYRIAELYLCCSYIALREACTAILIHLSLYLTPSDTKGCHFQNNFLAVTCHATKAVKKTVLELIVQFCCRRREGEALWIFLTTLPWRNLRNPADVHNTSFALVVAMETLSGKVQRQTEIKQCGDEVEQQTEQRR